MTEPSDPTKKRKGDTESDGQPQQTSEDPAVELKRSLVHSDKLSVEKEAVSESAEETDHVHGIEKDMKGVGLLDTEKVISSETLLHDSEVCLLFKDLKVTTTICCFSLGSQFRSWVWWVFSCGQINPWIISFCQVQHFL
jgi:hypothetical protein